MTDHLEIATPDGRAPAFAYGDRSAPRVLLLIDGLGMRAAMHALAARLGDEGYRVLMPDTFYRLGAYTAPEPRALFADPAAASAWFARLGQTSAAAYLGDVGAYLDQLGSGPVGVTGYCMGGRLALATAATYPERVVAAAAYHPGGLVTAEPDSPHRRFGEIRAKVYIGAATDDPSFTAEHRRIVAQALAAGGVDHTIEVYPRPTRRRTTPPARSATSRRCSSSSGARSADPEAGTSSPAPRLSSRVLPEMATYVDGFVIPLPRRNLAAYRKMALGGRKIWMKHGALQYFECVGDDLEIPKGMGLGFPKGLKLKAGETVIFAFIVYKSKAHRDAVNKKVMSDPAMGQMPGRMPFDPTRFLYGGFRTLVEG